MGGATRLDCTVWLLSLDTRIELGIFGYSAAWLFICLATTLATYWTVARLIGLANPFSYRVTQLGCKQFFFLEALVSVLNSCRCMKLRSVHE